MARKVTSGHTGGTDAVTGEFPSIRRSEARRGVADDMAAMDSAAMLTGDTGCYPSYAPITITSSQPLVGVGTPDAGLATDALPAKAAQSPKKPVKGSVLAVAEAARRQSSERSQRRRDSLNRTPQSESDGDDMGGTPLVVLLWIAIAGIIGAMAIWWLLPLTPAYRQGKLPQWYMRASQNSDWLAEAAEYIPLVVGATVVVLLLALLLHRRILTAMCIVSIVMELACGIGYFVSSGSTPQGTTLNLRDGEDSAMALPAGASAGVSVDVSGGVDASSPC